MSSAQYIHFKLCIRMQSTPEQLNVCRNVYIYETGLLVPHTRETNLTFRSLLNFFMVRAWIIYDIVIENPAWAFLSIPISTGLNGDGHGCLFGYRIYKGFYFLFLKTWLSLILLVSRSFPLKSACFLFFLSVRDWTTSRYNYLNKFD